MEEVHHSMEVCQEVAAMVVVHLEEEDHQEEEVKLTLLKEEGPACFARGMQARILIHAPSVAICWTTYESVKHALGRYHILE